MREFGPLEGAMASLRRAGIHRHRGPGRVLTAARAPAA
jgi:hypothetical protein